MAKHDEDILLTDSMKEKSQTELDQGTAERVAHREHVKRMKQYKKKKKRKIIGLALECVLLAAVCAGLWGINFVANAMNRVKISTPASEENTNDLPDGSSSTPPSASFIVENEDGSTEIIYYTIPNTETEQQGNTELPETAGNTEATQNTEGTKADPAPTEIPTPVKTGFSTYAIFGVDARDTEHLERWTQGDVVILVSLNNETKEVKLCSVFRDYAFESETDGGLSKITDSFCKYGVQHTVEAINRNFDLKIDDYAVVNWTAVADVVDALGGIDMYLTAAEAEQMGWYVYETELATKRNYTVKGLPKVEGVHHLNGGQALAVARIRKGVGDDFGRTERQRKIIGLILEKAKTVNLNQIYAIINVIIDNVRISFDNVEVLSLAKDVFKYRITETAGYPFDRIVFADPTSKVYPTDMSANVKQLHSFLYGDSAYTPSGNITRISFYQEQEKDYFRTRQAQ